MEGKNIDTKRSVSIEYNGHVYDSITEAVKKTGDSIYSIRKYGIRKNDKVTICIEGIEYSSISDAMRQTGYGRYKIKNMMNRK